jgi:hypothetical protein
VRNYYDNWENEQFDCPACKWHGLGEALTLGDYNWESAERLCPACEEISPSGEYAGLHCGYEICKTGRTKIKTAAPPTVVAESGAKHHRLPQLLGLTAVALLCRLFSAHCLAADVAFSNDNQRIYAVSSTDNETKPALREINLSTNTVGVIRLRELADHEEVFGVASGDGGKILFTTSKDMFTTRTYGNLWAFDPRTSRATKLCSAPPASPFREIAYDPKTHTTYVTIQAENGPLFMVKTGCELVPVMMQPHAEISNLAFSSEGKLFYEQSGDLWCGEIKSDGDNLRLEAERYAQGRQLLRAAGLEDLVDTSDSAAWGRYIVNLAAARDGVYVQLWQYHNRGQGFGALLKLPPPARNAEADTHSGTGEPAVKKPGQHQQTLQGVKSVGETKYPILLGASPDGSRVYYNTGEGEYLVTNGRTEKLQLRKTDRNANTGASTSVDANSAEATAEPPSSPTISSDAIAAVAEREIDAISTQNIDTLVSFYADKVDLLDKGMVSKDTVRNNLQQYFDRWPITKWKIAGRVDVKSLSASRYQLAFPVAFEVANPATNRRIVGTANETRTVVIDSAGTAKIVSQREKIIRSRTLTNSR